MRVARDERDIAVHMTAEDRPHGARHDRAFAARADGLRDHVARVHGQLRFARAERPAAAWGVHGHRAIQPYAQLAPDLLQRSPFAQASHVYPVDAYAGGDQVAARVVIQVRDKREQQHERDG